MKRTITIRGEGKVVAKVDYVIITMNLESEDKEYQKAMDLANVSIESLTSSLVDIGFKNDDLKTANFNVSTEYDSVEDKDGNYKQVFRGYVVTHDLKLGFDFETNRLAEVLNAISGCASKPSLSILFTVKDGKAVNEEMLRLITANARKKAEILCENAGVKLGEILSINYRGNERDFYSYTNFEIEEKNRGFALARSMDFTPEDIKVNDSATFVWEIE